MLKTPEHCSNT